MKLSDVIKVIAAELKASDLKEINKLLKDEPAVKFRITGKSLGHFGFTGQIKNISEQGVKVFMSNKVSLIRLEEIETFEKAKPRTERPVRAAQPATTPAPAKAAVKKAKAPVKLEDDFDDDDGEDFDDEGDDDFDEEELRPKKLKKNKTKPVGKSGSRFIPSGKK